MGGGSIIAVGLGVALVASGLHFSRKQLADIFFARLDPHFGLDEGETPDCDRPAKALRRDSFQGKSVETDANAHGTGLESWLPAGFGNLAADRGARGVGYGFLAADRPGYDVRTRHGGAR